MLRFAKYFSFALVLVTAAYLLLEKPRQATQEVAIGGEFSLLNPQGERVTNDSLKGKPRLVYFGFTFCPDICPTALLAMQQAARILEKDAPQQIFITVDPERDTMEALAAYAENFPGLIALTGSAEEIKQAAMAYRIYYQKAAQGKDSAEYMMDHSSFIYLMDAQGKYLAHFPHTIAPDALAEGVRKAL